MFKFDNQNETNHASLSSEFGLRYRFYLADGDIKCRSNNSVYIVPRKHIHDSNLMNESNEVI